MIEIVFGDSACGSLKLAQHAGEGVIGGAVSVILTHEDGAAPTEQELRDAQRQAELEQRREWETAALMGGNPRDVYGFSLALSVGDIAGDIFGDARRDVLSALYGVFPHGGEVADTLLRDAQDNVRTVLARAAQGEAVRIWYSDQPDERCGLCWSMAQLDALPSHGDIFLVKLPDWDADTNGSAVHQVSWGDVPPGAWASHAARQTQATDALCRALAQQWRGLQRENAPLRAVINGQLCGVPADFYDGFLRREIARQPEQFHQATVIGHVLGAYRLGISDAWIALRMEEMIRAGQLTPVTQPAEGDPVYHRMLRKTGDI